MLLPLLFSLAIISAPPIAVPANLIQGQLAATGQSIQDSLPALHTLRDEDIASVTSRHEDQTLTVNMKNGTVYLYHHIDWDLEDTYPTTPERIKAAVDDLGHITFTKAEHMPEFPGGDSAWQKYLDTFCTAHKKDIHKAGPADVMVQFTVHLKGQLTYIEPISGPYNAKQTALALQAIRESQPWTPATQNGHLVVCFQKVKVTLQ
ncbi:MAG: hypothetical protein BGO55_30970 [Sphingobacteriales bacterium 50-39]|nr:hypothetical protein [Sphingobacteriales bacterium]OJW60940.1 MAG: hypothetical protein BGO55_30970 [Sphingobacteriales bacterium 50-39]